MLDKSVGKGSVRYVCWPNLLFSKAIDYRGHFKIKIESSLYHGRVFRNKYFEFETDVLIEYLYSKFFHLTRSI